MTVSGVVVALLNDSAIYERWVVTKGLYIRRLMDECFLVCTGNAEIDAALEQALFEILADSYEIHVDVKRNRDNMRRLYSFAQEQCPEKDALVVDWGCGPGVVNEEIRAKGVRVVGVDTSPSMRRRARENGLLALTPKEATRRFKRRAQIVVAGYLLHLPVGESAIRMIGEIVCQGGVIAANFHKGNGIATFEDVIQSDPVFSRIDVPPAHPLHGPTRAFRRIG
jgi:SAM-dependent methyltransferase